MSTLVISTAHNPVFRNMNKRLVDGYKRQGIIPSLGEHRVNFEQAYGVKVTGDDGWASWSKVEFPDEQAYMMAVLKWAS